MEMGAGGWLEPTQVLCSYIPPQDPGRAIFCSGRVPATQTLPSHQDLLIQGRPLALVACEAREDIAVVAWTGGWG